MAIIPIYNCFHPVLKKKTEPVKEIDENIKKLVENMFETMYNADGSGLAGNQVGETKSIVVIDVSYYDGKIKVPPVALINPEIVSSSDELSDFQEGCLSIPTFYETVVRPKQVQVRYYDLDMREHVIEADELFARVVQHEIDHLNGILFIDRLTPIRKTLAKNKLKKIQKGLITADYPMILPDGSMAE